MLRTLILTASLTSGLGAGFLALNTSSASEVESVVSPPQTAIPVEEILVAAVEIEQGQMIGASNLQWQEWPTSAINGNLVTKSARPEAMSELEGTIMRSRLLAGEPLREERLRQGNVGYLAAMLPSGKRAVAVKVSPESSAGGFILPNDHVDVLMTAREDDQSELKTDTILHNVKVLAIDQLVDGSETETVVGRTATLELDPSQSEAIIAAEASGMLSLVLRSITDVLEPQPDFQVTEVTLVAAEEEQVIPRTVRVRRAGIVEVVVLP